MEPQLVQVRCQCQHLGAYSGFPPAPPEWRCNNCRADPEGCRVARRAVAAYRAGHPKAEATLGAMLQSAIKRGHFQLEIVSFFCFSNHVIFSKYLPWYTQRGWSRILKGFVFLPIEKC